MAKKTVSKKSAVKQNEKTVRHFNAWSLSVFVYWFIILFFVSATFYILGRGYGILHPVSADNVEITEEILSGADDYMQSGRLNLAAGNLEDAITDFTVALQSSGANVDAYLMRGEAYMQLGSYAAANDDFDSAIAADSENAVAFYDRALLKMRSEDYQGALADINNALAARAVKQTDVIGLRDIYAKRGQLNLWLKNWDGAVADYTNSLARPEGYVNPNVYAERAEAYTALGDYAAAANDYISAVRVVSEQIQAAESDSVREDLSRRATGWFEKSAALNLRLGNIESARTDLESAYAIAAALDDAETVGRLEKLIMELQ